MSKIYTVTELADDLGITPRTIRFYEAKGLLMPQRLGNTRAYTYRERARMLLILRGKRLGFSLADIKEYLDLYEVDMTQASQTRLLLEKVRRRLADLQQQREDLEAAVEELQEVERQAQAALSDLDQKVANGRS